MARSKKISVDRRGFLKGAAAGAAAGVTALVVKPEAAKAQEAAEVHRPAAPLPATPAKSAACKPSSSMRALSRGER